MSAWVGYIHPEPMMVMPNNKSLLLYIVQRFKMVNRRYRRLQSFIGNGKREITSSHQPENGLVTDWGRTLASEPKTSRRRLASKSLSHIEKDFRRTLLLHRQMRELKQI